MGNHQHVTTQSTRPTAPAGRRFTCPPCVASPISPPTSPSFSSSTTLRPPQQHPIDVLAYRLRNQSLVPRSRSPLQTPLNPASALSPTSMPDDDVVPSPILPGASMAMEVDADEDAMTIPTIHRPCSRPPRNGLGIMAPTPPSGSSSINHPSPSAAPRSPILEPKEENANQPIYEPQYGLMCTEIEADEGYCEAEDDFSWIDSVVSMTRPMASGDYKARYGLDFRTSREAASRCKNAIHSVPRMRRRDKKQRRRRLESMSASGSATLTTQ
ncbi:hypothetical protein B0T10DRAFT_452424 [Thelonectria olida]|uniref:Uncharacterized protein n=1 Tax=Thelonectria olida TaxID=1576542 RepID=A0A9P8WIE1_9HYPO|nr:hypothetical protein B0T10DRAFT_452424 [Thelonectria olida]